MRIIALAFAVSSLVACVDEVTPVGVDDIEENTDDNFGPGTLKGDVDPPTGEQPNSHRPAAGVLNNELLPTTNQVTKLKGSIGVAVEPSVELNPVPRR